MKRSMFDCVRCLRTKEVVELDPGTVDRAGVSPSFEASASAKEATLPARRASGPVEPRLFPTRR